ncbi:hypothetical protein HNR55_002590 [Acetobacter lovaniensis]|uniref:Uncharacterized protein n=1 Tax=Acetobacter lovaniensis TaxID=104100 RepID=A0A841QHS4_9PROT|nr:hypothetical protein [Acetobacter lovaniensis]
MRRFCRCGMIGCVDRNRLYRGRYLAYSSGSAVGWVESRSVGAGRLSFIRVYNPVDSGYCRKISTRKNAGLRAFSLYIRGVL